MDYSLFTEKILDNRYESFPASLRAVFEAEQTRKIIANIEREHYLNPDKSLILEQLIGLTLMGFIPLRGLSREVGEQLFLNFEHAQVLTNEIYNRILAPYEDEISEIYKPVEEVIAETEQVREAINSQPKKTDSEEGSEEIIKPDFFNREIKESPIKIETSEDAPLIIHEEPSFFTKQERDEREKQQQTETPFNKFIPSSSESTEKKIPRVKIEGGNNPFSFLKQTQGATVHYSEIRSGLKSEIGPESEVISIGAIDRMTERHEEQKQSVEPIQQPPIHIQAPEIINISPSIAQKPDNILIQSAAKPEIKTERKTSWISNIFKQKGLKEIGTGLPKVQINEQKPEETASIIQGNTINLK